MKIISIREQRAAALDDIVLIPVRDQRAEQIRQCAEAGMTRSEAAAQLGVSRSYVGQIAKTNTIAFNRAPGAPSPKQERNAEIIRRFEAGENLAAIAVTLGISRERARQVVKRGGVKSAKDRRHERRQAIANAIAVGEFPEEVATRFGISYGAAVKAAHDHGVALPRRPMKDEEFIAALAERVRNGESFYRASGGDGAVQNRLMRYCAKHGIKSQHKSRNPNHTPPRDVGAVA